MKFHFFVTMIGASIALEPNARAGSRGFATFCIDL